MTVRSAWSETSLRSPCWYESVRGHISFHRTVNVVIILLHAYVSNSEWLCTETDMKFCIMPQMSEHYLFVLFAGHLFSARQHVDGDDREPACADDGGRHRAGQLRIAYCC